MPCAIFSRSSVLNIDIGQRGVDRLLEAHDIQRRIAVAVPCHRVVKSDGSISGYRWGVQRKRRLINMEGVV